MPYTMGWYIKNEVLFAQCGVSLSVEEAHNLLMDVNANTAQSNHPAVHAIFDLSKIEKPLGLLETAQALRGATAHPRVGWMVTVGEQDKLVKFSSTVARQLLRARQRSFLTIEEAIAFLKDIDSTIDWSQADDSVLDRPEDQ